MKNAAEYLAWIEALIVDNPHIRHYFIVREEAQGNSGLFRYRLELDDGTMLEMFERFEIAETMVEAKKYSFHWQAADGHLLVRWDNASHHPDIGTHPHHKHESTETNVMPHEPMCAESVLRCIGREDGESNEVEDT